MKQNNENVIFKGANLEMSGNNIISNNIKIYFNDDEDDGGLCDPFDDNNTDGWEY